MSKVIPAKNGNLQALNAEESIFLWAKHMGHSGEKLDSPSSKRGNVEAFSYLNGDVIHFKVVGAGHNALRSVPEKRVCRLY